MIKLKKKRPAPIIRDKDGNDRCVLSTDINNTRYDTNPLDYDSGNEKFDFDSGIYGHSSIKKSLIASQSGKCAFCEQNVLNVSYGDVEHFRPKGGYKQGDSDMLSKPGYYWLAYSWDNFLFVCQSCNQRHKKNLFPIINVLKRANNHHDLLKFEKPIFINPYIENPKFLIGFNQEVAKGLDKKARGKKTIDALGLNRRGSDKGYGDLYEIRKDYFKLFRNTYKISKMEPGADVTQEEIDEALLLVSEMRKKDKQFSAMINCNFPH